LRIFAMGMTLAPFLGLAQVTVFRPIHGLGGILRSGIDVSALGELPSPSFFWVLMPRPFLR
jgi:hypothetical protein